MKKRIMAVVLISGLALATAASANWGRGGGGAGYYGACPMVQGGQVPYYQQTDPAVQEKVNQFFLDTQDLRKQIVVKQSERRAFMQNTNPDPAAVAKLTGELFDLRNDMREKAVAAGVDQYVGPGMMGGGFGPGRGGYGGGRGGRMMGGPGGPGY